MREIAARHAESWPTGRPFRLLERMREITDEIFVRLVLGVGDEQIATDLIAAIRRMLNTPGNPPLTLPGRGDGLAGALGQKIFERRQAPVAHHLARAVEARRAQDAADVPDVLGGMVAAEPALRTEEIVDELMSLLMAAQEPPAIALTWLADRISREAGLAAEFEAEPDGARAGAVIAETLRLQPPASAALRRLSEPFEAGRLTLPAGMVVLLPTSLLQRDPRAFAQPDEFGPDRWREQEAPPGSYFPFGGGDRRCVGEPLAQAEFSTVLPAIFSRVRLTPLADAPEPMVQRATVLVPKRSLLVRAERTSG
jgi:cytochrome P450